MQRWGRGIQAAIGGLTLLTLIACAPAHRAPVTDTASGPRYLSDGRQHRVNSGETLYTIAWLYDLDHRLLAQVNELSPPYTIYTGQKLTVDLRGHQLRPAEPPAARVYQAVNTSPPVSTPVPSSAPVSSTPLPSAGTVATSPPQNSPPARGTSPPPVADRPSADAGSGGKVAAPSPVPAPSASPPSSAGGGGAVAGTGAVNWAWPADGQVIGRFSSASTGTKGINIAGQAGDPVRAAADGEVVYAGSALLRYGDMLIVKHNDRFLSAYAHNRRLLVREGDPVRRGQPIAELGSTGVDRNMLHFEIRDSGKPVDPLTFLPKR